MRRGLLLERDASGISQHERLSQRAGKVALNLVVNCIMVVFAVVSAVTGAFGMNLNAWMPQSEASSKSAFLAALLCSVGFGLTMSFGILAYARDHRLLFIANGTAT